MFIWTAQDPRGFDDATAQAVARCSAGAWGIDEIGVSKGTPEEDLLILIARSLVIRQALVAAGNAAKYPAPAGNRLAINVVADSWGNPVSDVDHVNAQYILIRTWEVLARGQGWTEGDASQLSATSGKPVTSSNVVAIVAIVVGIVVLAGLIAFTVYNVNALIDRALARQAQAQELMRAHAECQKMLEDHAAAERSAGKPIPFSIAELAVMARLAKLQDSAARGFESTLAPPLGGSPQPKTATDVIENVLTLAVLLGFGYFLIRREI